MAKDKYNEHKKTGTSEYHAFMTRLLRSYGRKAKEGQLDSTALAQLTEIQAMLEEQIAETVAALRSEVGGQHSWAEIADGLGITRSAAFKRYSHLDSKDVRTVGGQPARLR